VSCGTESSLIVVTARPRSARTRESAGVINNIVYVTQDALTGKMAAYIFAGFAGELVSGSTSRYEAADSSGAHGRLALSQWMEWGSSP